jgi:hypothetical protein
MKKEKKEILIVTQTMRKYMKKEKKEILIVTQTINIPTCSSKLILK